MIDESCVVKFFVATGWVCSSTLNPGKYIHFFAFIFFETKLFFWIAKQLEVKTIQEDLDI
jgi:hypothetical protein